MGKFNDLDLKNWRQYLGDLTTDSLWIDVNNLKNSGKFIYPKRDWGFKNDSGFHGLFVPEIPYQMTKRFTKAGETVWDCFGGSGTTYRVCQMLNRKCIINDINPKHEYITRGDSLYFSPETNVQLIIMHPPYHNIVKYSDKKNDGSNQNTIEEFLDWFRRCVDNVEYFLDKQRFLILVCGNLYFNGEEHTLGVWCKDIVREFGFKCKSHIIKDYGETKGTEKKNYNLNFYRGLKGNYNSFYGDNIFILQKS